MKSILITGTDTDIGKTVLTSALVAYWQRYHSVKTLGLMKLIQTGVGDGEWYEQLFGSNQVIEIVTGLRFDAPLAPPIAAAYENRSVELDEVWQAFCSLQRQKDFVIIEALGGLGSPVTWELTVADIAQAWGLATFLVVPVQLGAIAQSVANVALARQTGVNLQGIILNCVRPTSLAQLEDWTPIKLIESLTYIPVVGVLPYLENLQDLEQLAHAAANLELEKIFGNL